MITATVTRISGAWLGALPDSWSRLPFQVLFCDRKQASTQDDVHLTPSQKYGVMPQSEYIELTGNRVVLNLAGADNMRHVEPGDFISHLRSFQGGLEHSALPGKVSSAYTVIAPQVAIDPGYFRHLFKSVSFIQALQSTTDQLRDGQSIRFGELKLIELPYPPVETQKAIADFLDRETAEIDAFVAESEKLITLLNERRTAIITQAVTKGLDPNVPMKDTDIEWLGSIPRHWTIRRASELGTLLNGYPFASESFNAYSNGAIPVVKIADVLGNEFQHYVNRDDLPSNPPLVHQDDLVIGLSGDFNVTLWTREPAVLNQRTAAFRCHDNRLPGFVLHLLSVAIKYEHEMQHSTTLKNLAPGAIMRLRIPIPPSEELLKILSVTNTATAKIDKAIQASQQAIALAKERRQALISAAVTGKIDVRGAA